MVTEVYTVKSISKSIWSISEGSVRMFLIEGEDKALLIDTGFGGGNLKEFVATLTQKPIIVVNTHSHIDHVGGNSNFDTVYAHPAEFYGIRKTTNTSYNSSFKLVSVKEGFVFSLGNCDLEVIDIPGHTPGSIAILDRKNRMLFSGDSLQTGPVYILTEGSSIEAFIYSMQHLLDIKDRYETIYPSHNQEVIDSSFAEELINCAKATITGNLTGETTTSAFGQKCKIYRWGKVALLYND